MKLAETKLFISRIFEKRREHYNQNGIQQLNNWKRLVFQGTLTVKYFYFFFNQRLFKSKNWVFLEQLTTSMNICYKIISQKLRVSNLKSRSCFSS